MGQTRTRWSILEAFSYHWPGEEKYNCLIADDLFVFRDSLRRWDGIHPQTQGGERETSGGMRQRVTSR